MRNQDKFRTYIDSLLRTQAVVELTYQQLSVVPEITQMSFDHTLNLINLKKNTISEVAELLLTEEEFANEFVPLVQELGATIMQEVQDARSNRDQRTEDEPCRDGGRDDHGMESGSGGA